MKSIAIFFTACLLLSVACKRRMTAAEVKEQLENAMTKHLEQNPTGNTLHPSFKVLDVAWFEEHKYYKCEFTVKMTLPDGRDTTGIRKERISKDFATFDVPIDPGR
jgi:hypothetical protein